MESTDFLYFFGELSIENPHKNIECPVLQAMEVSSADHPNISRKVPVGNRLTVYYLLAGVTYAIEFC